MIHRLPRRMPGMIPCSNIAYTASRPISNRRAISGTVMRLLRDVDIPSLGHPELRSATGSDMKLLARVLCCWVHQFRDACGSDLLQHGGQRDSAMPRVLPAAPDRHVFASQASRCGTVHFCLAFQADQSEESSCASRRGKGYK